MSREHEPRLNSSKKNMGTDPIIIIINDLCF